jgi:hypothetical protein
VAGDHQQAGAMINMPENEYTSTVYGLIKDGRYTSAVEHLEPILQVFLPDWPGHCRGSLASCQLVIRLPTS